MRSIFSKWLFTQTERIFILLKWLCNPFLKDTFDPIQHLEGREIKFLLFRAYFHELHISRLPLSLSLLLCRKNQLANSKNGGKNRKNEIKKRIQPREIIAHLFSSLLVESFHGDQVSICFFRLSSRLIIWKRNVRGLPERGVRGSREKGEKGLA